MLFSHKEGSGNPVIYNITASDEDNDNLIYSISGEDSQYLLVDQNSGKVSLNLQDGIEPKSLYNFDVTVSDGESSDTKSISINVSDIGETGGNQGGDLGGDQGGNQTEIYTIDGEVTEINNNINDDNGDTDDQIYSNYSHSTNKSQRRLSNGRRPSFR